jgi:hypothetical protein
LLGLLSFLLGAVFEPRLVLIEEGEDALLPGLVQGGADELIVGGVFQALEQGITCGVHGALLSG